MRVALLPLPAQNHEGVEKILKKMFKKLTVMPISLELSFPEAYALMQEQLTTLAETRAKLTKPKGRLSPSSLLSASNWDTSISASPAQVSAVGREIPDIGTTRITSAGIEVLDIEVGAFPLEDPPPDDTQAPPQPAEAQDCIDKWWDRLQCDFFVCRDGVKLRMGPPIFVLCSLATLAATATINRTSPAPMTWFPLMVVGVGHSVAMPYITTRRDFKRAAVFSCAFFVVAELTLLALALESLLRAVTTYNRGWCDVPARAASTTMCDALVATWIARAIVAVVCLISFGRALQMACWGEPPVAARAFRVSVCMHACFFVIVHLCVWGAILLLGKEGDDFSATRVCLAVIVGANDGVLEGLGVPSLQ